MGIFSKLVTLVRGMSDKQQSPEVARLGAYEACLDSLLSQDKYLARSDYKAILEEFKELYNTFLQLRSTGTLEFYGISNSVKKERIENFLNDYEDLCSDNGSNIIKRHNETFLRRHLNSEKSYLDNILKKVDPVINLDDEQRKVVLSDEDYTLVIAGAGAGKTTTVAAKVRYLVEHKGIKPEQILVISFTNKAVGELRDKINRDLKIKCPVTTFHKTGYAILRRQDEGIKTVVDQGFMFNVINNYLKGNILENPELVEKLILFFGSYFDAPYEGDDLNAFFNSIKKGDFTTLKGNMKEYAEEVIDKRTGRCITIAHETLRSRQEVLIANFLYLHNIEYTYEKPYPYNIPNSVKTYTPDFTITQGDKVAYIEHFGISEEGQNSRYTLEQLEKYKQAVRDKIRLHQQHRTDLIYTFSRYKDKRSLLEHLKEKLEKYGFNLVPRDPKEVFEKIVNTEENRYILQLVNLICNFIRGFKTNGNSVDDFYTLYHRTNNERTKLFLTICEQCYHEYSKRLKEKNAVDFEDMINDSARILREQELRGERLDFKYIIVDEYQDISRQRFNLTKELSKLCSAKIIAVGDDWQSIYAYAGSDITLFTQFKKTFGYGEELSITKTYRNAQEVIDIAGGFIQKNTAQIRKALVSPKHIDNPIIIETYSEEVEREKTQGKGGSYYLIGQTVESIMDTIYAEKPDASILLLGRYGFDAYNLGKSADFVYDDKTGNVYSKKYQDKKFDFMTVHRAKGLGYDYVIVINARSGTYGFPSQIQDDPVLKHVLKDDNTFTFAEERRLFYVALTRTKNRVFVVTPQQHPSEFVLELVQDYPSITVHGELKPDTSKTEKDKHMCPICGYPLQLRYKKAYGLRLWLCANEPEICDFMTNDLRGGKLSILKCPSCTDGYLIIKGGKNGPFLGCSNYKADKTGCNCMRTVQEYYRMIGQRKY